MALCYNFKQTRQRWLIGINFGFVHIDNISEIKKRLKDKRLKDIVVIAGWMVTIIYFTA